MDDYRVDLDIYQGPLDLLLHLVRRNEVEIEDIPIASICDQFLERLEHIKEIDLTNAGDFILMAATLMDIKSRTLVPSETLVGPEEETGAEGEKEDPRADLVRELLEYKRYRDRARGLEKALGRSAQRVPRPTDPSLLEVDEEGKPLREPGFGELIRAFIQVVRQMQAVSRKPVLMEDVPLKEFLEEITRTLSDAPDRSRSFFTFFKKGTDYGRVIGIFLAILELAKERKIRVEQAETGEDIFLVLRPEDEWIRTEDLEKEKTEAGDDEPLIVDPESRITWRDQLPPGWVKTEEGYIFVGIKKPEPAAVANQTDQETGRPGDTEKREETPIEATSNNVGADLRVRPNVGADLRVRPDGRPDTPVGPGPDARPDVGADLRVRPDGRPGTPVGPGPNAHPDGRPDTPVGPGPDTQPDGRPDTPVGPVPGAAPALPEGLLGKKKKKESVEDLISAAENFDLGDLEVEGPIEPEGNSTPEE